MHLPPDAHLLVEATRHAELQDRSRRWRLLTDARTARRVAAAPAPAASAPAWRRALAPLSALVS